MARLRPPSRLLGHLLRGTAATGALFLIGCGERDETAKSTGSEAAGPVPALSANAPKIPKGFVFRPVFRTLEGDFSAGIAFFASTPDGTRLLLTSAQLFGPAGGYFREYRPAHANSPLRGMGLRDAFSGEARFDPRARPLLLPSASFGRASKSGDVEAFVLEDKEVIDGLEVPLESPPELSSGDTVWVVGPLDPNSSGRLFLGEVTDISDGYVHYRLIINELEPSSVAGAPVVDDAGKLVAIHAAGAKLSDGTILGAGTPLSRFVPHLREALQASPTDLTAQNANRPADSANPTQE
ncbi:MAG: hypothetical protein AAGJ79_07110 [Verrucomicrobiota bacterium]